MQSWIERQSVRKIFQRFYIIAQFFMSQSSIEKYTGIMGFQTQQLGVGLDR